MTKKDQFVTVSKDMIKDAISELESYLRKLEIEHDQLELEIQDVEDTIHSLQRGLVQK